MKNRYLDVARIISNSLSNAEDKKLKEYLGRTAISRAYEAVFLELYYYFTEDLNVSYPELKKVAKDYYKNKGIKISINKHTATGAYLTLKYGEFYGELFEQLRKARNDVDYNLELTIINRNLILREVREYIKRAEIIIYEVFK